jgi:hypothetical protein
VNQDANYTAALREYRQAMKIKGGMETVKDLAFRRLLPWGAGALGLGAAGKVGYDLFK